MLKYIWQVSQDLFLTVTFVTLIYVMALRIAGKKALRIQWTGIVLGITASVIFAYVKNTTNKIITSHWNHYLYLIIIGFTLLYLALSIFCRNKKTEGLNTLTIVFCTTGACLSALWIFFRLPAVLFYPFNFNTMGNGILSWYYLQRLLGWAISLIVLSIYAQLLRECAFQIKKQTIPLAVLNAGTVVNAVYCFGYFFVPWVNRAKWLHSAFPYSAEKYPWARSLVMITSTKAMMFIWIVAALAALLVFLFFLENTKITEPYDNPAQKRKIRAGHRRHRRQSVATLLFLAVIIVDLSIVKAYDTRVVELSAPETYTVSDNAILIPVDLVSDGHLHRFEYQTEKGINVRWIVVKKPGSASFGVGLDACEVCGNAGYFERNGQVICKRCDVVMNINTIGFKGGCNPIPLSYEVKDGNMVFTLADLAAGEKEFR